MRLTHAQPTLGIIAICKNEEIDLPGFLSHLIPWVDEIVLVDDESTDDTLEIARAFAPKVRCINHPMQPQFGFAGQRNAGIQAATADWLLHMDIDERVPAALGQEILRAIQDPNYNGFRYRRMNYFLHRPMYSGGLQLWNNPQLGRRGYHHFERNLHEKCMVEGLVGQLNNVMWHLNDANYAERMRKSVHYCQYEAQRLIDQNHIIRWYDFFVYPALKFVKGYALQRGFRDGIPGLIFALHSADAVFRTYALAWDLQNRLSRDELEAQIRQDWQSLRDKSNI